jgi:hypothetical protein
MTSTLLARLTDSGAQGADSTHDMKGIDMKETKCSLRVAVHHDQSDRSIAITRIGRS